MARLNLPVIGGSFDIESPVRPELVSGRVYLRYTQSYVSTHHWTFRCPPNYDSSPGLRIQFISNVAGPGNVVFGAQLFPVTPGDAQSLDVDNYASSASAVFAAATTQGHIAIANYTFTGDGGLQANDWVALRLSRNALSGSDTLAGFARVVALEFTYTAA